MRLFGKNVKAKVRADLAGRLGMIILSGLLLLSVGVCSFAWFARNNRTTAGGMSIVVRTQTYELLVDRTAAYDSGYPFITDAGKTKDSLVADSYSLTATSSASSFIAYELINEYRFENKYNLMPGAYGSLSLYLNLSTGISQVTVNFSLELGGFVVKYDNEGNESFSAITSTTVLNLLKGHIMFFTERTGNTFADYRYGGLVENGTFSYNTLQHSKCTESGKENYYKITLYWEWPITYYDIVDNLSTNETTLRFPPEVGAYLNNTEYFFLYVEDGADIHVISDAYNDADQAIGNGANSIVVYLKAS